MSFGLLSPPGGWGLQKPPLGVGIDREHRLGQGLVGCWPFNEGAGRSVMDQAGRGHGVVTTGDTAWTPTDRGTTMKFTTAGAAYVVCKDANGSHNDSAVFCDLSYSISVLFYPTNPAGSSQDIVSRVTKTGGAFAGWYMYLNGGRLYFIIASGSSEKAVYTYANSLVLGNWYIATCQPCRAIWLNGRNRTQSASSPIAPSVSTERLVFGARHAWGNYYVFDGLIASVWIHHRLLTDAEICRLHAEPFGMFKAAG